jgi:hypothetical protein
MVITSKNLKKMKNQYIKGFNLKIILKSIKNLNLPKKNLIKIIIM